MSDCKHENFGANVEVNRITNDSGEVQRYSADVRVWCMECGKPFRFIGLPAGLDLTGAATSADAQEARLAIAPAGEVLAIIDEGCTGFSIRKQ